MRRLLRRAIRQVWCGGLLLLCAACSLFAPSDRFDAVPTAFTSLSGWEMDDHAAALAAFGRSCAVHTASGRAPTSHSDIVITQDVWRQLCAKASRTAPAQARLFFEREFIPYRIANRGSEQGLFTGYYEPMLYGAPHPGHDFIYPVYGLPPDVKEGKPYYSRKEIDDGALGGKKLELLWVDDPVMLFFLHIQGSGRVKLTNGKEVRLAYAGKNHHPYVGLGKIMKEEELIAPDEINFFTIRGWLYQHKDQAFAMMQRNPSYVFFTLNHGEGPFGGSGAVLTPERSLAIDARYIPYGLPVYLETFLPETKGRAAIPYQRLLMAQDTGGAIKGPVRGDIFFGAGDQAEYHAGNMAERGVYTVLVPRVSAAQFDAHDPR